MRPEANEGMNETFNERYRMSIKCEDKLRSVKQFAYHGLAYCVLNHFEIFPFLPS